MIKETLYNDMNVHCTMILTIIFTMLEFGIVTIIGAI